MSDKNQSGIPSCGIIMLGDFNKLITFSLRNRFNLKQIINFPTRGQNTSDLILTNMKSFYGDPIKLPPFGFSDHVSIKVLSLARSLFPKPAYRINSRDSRPSTNLMRKKVEILESIIKTGLFYWNCVA